MKKSLVILLISLALGACSSTKEAFSPKSKSIIKVKNILETAMKYQGVKYRFGGTNEFGMDCSGLVSSVYKENNILLPRASRDMAREGKEIPLESAKKGDLVFFVVRNKKNIIDHVGLITSIKDGKIHFMHATSAKGVIISSINDHYWQKTFSKAVTFL